MSHQHNHTHSDHNHQSAENCQSDCCGSKHQETHQHTHNEKEHHTSTCCDHTVLTENKTTEPSDIPVDWITSIWHVPEVDCPTEEAMIRKKLEKNTQLLLIECNPLKNRVRIAHLPENLQQAKTSLTELGFTPQQIDDQQSVIHSPHTTNKKQWIVLAISGTLALGAELLHGVNAPDWQVLSASIVSIALCGLSTFRNGLIALKNFNLNINALMSVAVIGAILIKQWPEAAMVIFLFTIAEMLEAYSLVRARQAIQKLMQLAPEFITIKDEQGQWQQISVNEVEIGAAARVKPGERIALDGVVTSGFSTVNQAPITGESVPVEKQKGDTVFAGTINESGSFEYQVSTTARQTTLARIIEAVEHAQSSRAPIQSFIDKFAAYYIPVVFALALIVAFIVPVFAGDWIGWIYKALVLLVISCPCALVISTPVTLVSGLSRAARNGILIKGGIFLEMGRKLNWLAMDKTGTLTHGRPEQTDYLSFDQEKASLHYIQAISLASRSDHPVSTAMIRATQDKELTLFEVAEFTALPGMGIQGQINQETFYLVNPRFLSQQAISYPEAIRMQIEQLQQAGKTVVLFCDQTQVLSAFAVADTIKEQVATTISQLHQIGVKTLMLTGDNQQVANAVAKEIGIDEVYAEQLPEDKLNVIQQKHQQGATIAMVGDGINDAPALAQADIGIAMGQLGTDTAVETADVVLMDDKLSKIIDYIGISRKTYSILVQNISFAIGVKLVFIFLTLIGFGTMWMAVFADVGATLLVVLNGLRLLANNQSAQ